MLIIETQSDGDQVDLDEIIYDPEGDACEDDFDVDQAATLGCVLSMHSSPINEVDRITHHLKMMIDVELQFFKRSLKLMVRLSGYNWQWELRQRRRLGYGN